MDAIDVDLRKGDALAGAVVHLLAYRRILAVVVFGESGLFASQQRFGGAAIAAARTGVDFDVSRHFALGLFANERRLYGSFRGVHNPVTRRPSRAKRHKCTEPVLFMPTL